MSERLSKRLTALKAEGRTGFVPFIMAGDPSLEITSKMLRELPAHGADIIELGMPFSDPMADGPTIQAAAIRALNAGTRLSDVLELVAGFRNTNNDTPIILMGYANPVYHYGVAKFMADAAIAGVDGLIIVDVPAEEMALLKDDATAHGIDIIRLIAPTSLAARLPLITQDATGFLYYIAVKGITGSGSADMQTLRHELDVVRAQSNLPVAVGFGINTKEDVAAMAKLADLVVVGSAIVKTIEGADDAAAAVLARCRELSSAIAK